MQIGSSESEMQTLRAGRPFQRVVNSAQALQPWQSVTLTLLVKQPGTQVVNVRVKETFSPGFNSLSFHTAWLPLIVAPLAATIEVELGATSVTTTSVKGLSPVFTTVIW